MKNNIEEQLELPCGSILSNRLCKTAMTEGLSDELNRSTDELCTLYEKWSKSGASLLITGNVQIDRRYMERAGNVAIDGKQSNMQIEKLKKWASAAKINGNHCWVQLGHAGRQTDARVNKVGLGPSPIRSRNIAGQIFMPSYAPKEISISEIGSIIDKFSYAAKVCKEVGFSGIQIHSAHGYLLSSFLNPLANVRTDSYGGKLENRYRLLLEIIIATRRSVGPNFPISVKINSSDFLRGGLTDQESATICKALDSEGIDLIEISGGNYENLAIFRGKNALNDKNINEAYFLDSSKEILNTIKNTPIMLTGGIRKLSTMNDLISNHNIDMIGLARPLCGLIDGPKKLIKKEIYELPKYEDKINYPFFLRWLKIFRFGKVIYKAAILLWCYDNIINISKNKPFDTKGEKINLINIIIKMYIYEWKKASSLREIKSRGLVYRQNF